MSDQFKKAMIANIEDPLDKAFEERRMLIEEIHVLVDEMRSNKDLEMIIGKLKEAIVMSDKITELIVRDNDDWIDPAGGTHSKDEQDPAKQYE